MGLGITVGQLAWCIANDYHEEAELAREDIAEINRVLAAHGLPPHVEPETLPAFQDRSAVWAGFPYSWLHYLRRAVAFARQAPKKFRPVAKGEDPAADPLVDRELSVLMDSHLICHSDGDGFYVPIDFPEPLYDARETGSIGALESSQQALKELLQVAPLLKIALKKGVLSDREAERIATEGEKDHPLWIERHAWLRLFERFRASVAHNAVVTFG
jgi:hypothetical protein